MLQMMLLQILHPHRLEVQAHQQCKAQMCRDRMHCIAKRETLSRKKTKRAVMPSKENKQQKKSSNANKNKQKERRSKYIHMIGVVRDGGDCLMGGVVFFN